ncbi:hypothetical protein LCGC14_2347560 [marine sediment metagenome]|uniref:Uncharacterized protein n=1 Tax=marine sediment metagenome TaxID=412755 RepID=A0A0F9F582_9ZZZZ
MPKTNPQIIQNTILERFNTEKRVLTKKDLVRLTKFTNRCVKDALTILETEKFLHRDTSGYQLIKTLKSVEVPPNLPEQHGDINTDVLSIFDSLKGENLNSTNLMGFLDEKYNQRQIKNCLARLVRKSSLVKIDRRLYTLPGEIKKPMVIKPALPGPYGTGLYRLMRTLFSSLPSPFNSKQFIDLVPDTYSNRQIRNGIDYLVTTGELMRLRQGIYTVVNKKAIVSEITTEGVIAKATNYSPIHVGIAFAIRKVLPNMPTQFNSKLLIETIPETFTKQQLRNGIFHLVQVGEIIKIKKALYPAVPQKSWGKKEIVSEVNVGDILE